MKKFYLILLLLFGFTVLVKAQHQRIVLFDCTESMKTNNCWDLALQKLEDVVSNADENSEVIIIPFQEKIYPVIQGSKVDLESNWDGVVKKLNKYIKDKHKGTCIVKALDEGGKYINRYGFNLLYLITDGMESNCGHSMTDLVDKIKNWCEEHNANSKNFYVPLKDEAMPLEFRQAIEKYCWIIADPNHVEANFYEDKIDINTEEIINGANKRLKFTRSDTWVIFMESSDPYFNVCLEDNQVCNSKANLRVSIKDEKQPEQIKQLLMEEGKIHDDDYYSFDARFVPESENLSFCDKDQIRVDVIFKLQKTMAFPDDIEVLDFGKSIYYPKFWPCNSHEPDTLTYTLKPSFNPEAIQKNSSVKMKLVCDEKDDKDVQFTLLCNDNLCQNNVFTIEAGKCDSCNLKLVFSSNSSAGKKHFHIEVVSVNMLDRITGHTQFESPYDCAIPVVAKFSKRWNPLSWIILIMFIAVALYCVLRVLYYQTKRGVFCGIDYFVNGNWEVLVEQKNCQRIILTRTPKKQNYLNWLFNGKTLYNVAPLEGLSSDIQLNSAGRRRGVMRMRFKPNTDYLFDGNTMHRQVVISDEDVSHSVSNTKNCLLTFKLY